jgi:hypothetical protein
MSAERLVSSNRIPDFTFNDVIALADASGVDASWSKFIRDEFCPSLKLTPDSRISALPIEPQWYAKERNASASSDIEKYDGKPVLREGDVYFNYVIGIPTKQSGEQLVVRVGSISKAHITEYFGQPTLPTRTIETFAKIKHMHLSKLATLLFSGFLALHKEHKTISIFPVSGEWVNVAKKLSEFDPKLGDKSAYLNVFNILATAQAVKSALGSAFSAYSFDFTCVREYISKPFDQISPQCREDIPYKLPAINGSPLPEHKAGIPTGSPVDIVLSVGSKDTITSMFKSLRIYEQYRDLLGNGKKLNRSEIVAKFNKERPAPRPPTFDELKSKNYGLYEAIMLDYARSLSKKKKAEAPAYKKRAASAQAVVVQRPAPVARR